MSRVVDTVTGEVVPDYPWPVHPAAEEFPLLSDGELREMADDIRAHGLREPVWLWNEAGRCLWLLDGRNRVRACQLAGVEPVTRFYVGDDPIAFSISANLKRRHLTPGQRDFLAVGVEKLYASAAKERQGERTDLSSNIPADLPECSPAEEDRAGRQLYGPDASLRRERESRERAAKITNASGRGVSQAKRVERQAPDLAEKVKTGQMAMNRAERIIRDREAEQRRIAQARAEAAAQPEPLRVDIRHGDFREVLSDLEDIDAVITDPPYPAEYLPLLADLASWADKVLAPDGVLAVLMGQTYLPEVYRLLDGHRPYRWTACYLTSGPSYVSHQRRVHANWKPLLVYGNGPRFADVIRAEGGDADAKSNHKWGQDYGAFHTIVERLTSRGQTVVDPFMGSGTTLLAAHALGRHVIGCDIDSAAVSTSRERVA